MIQKRGDKFVVTNKAGTKVLGTHASKEKAAKQLAAIEISKAKHMSENKSFKAFRNELNESEYREVLTGYPNRDIHCDGPVRFDDAMVGRVNAMLNAISRSTYLHPSEAFVKIKSRLNILMLDFPWTPYLWQGGDVGTVNLTVTRYGRVDGVDALTGEVRMDGKANTMDGFKEFTLVANIERAEDGLFRVTAKLQPMAIGVVEEDYQTPAREAEMKRKVEKHETAAQRGYEAKMTKTGKAAEKGRKQEDKHDAASRRLLKKDRKEQESSRTYGRGGKLVKSGSRAEVKEEIEQIDELSKATKDAYVAKRGSQLSSMLSGHKRGKQLTGKQQANAVKGIKQAMGVKEAAGQEATAKKVVDNSKKIKGLVGGQKRLDVNNNNRLDSQDFKMLRAKKKPMQEGLVGGQKKLDVNKNKRLDSQDFAMLRAKKKPMKTVREYLDMASGMALQSPAPGDAISDKSGKGKRFHKKALKSVSEAAKKPAMKTAKRKVESGAQNVIGQHKAIKKRLEKHDMRW